MAKHGNIRLTSAELSGLWANFLADSMSKCVLNHFYERCEDKEIQTVVKTAITLSENHLAFIKGLYTKEGIVLPMGFSSDDVNPGALRLFSDIYYLYYLENMTTMGLTTYGAFLSGSTREDVRQYVSKCLASTIELYNQTSQLLLEKGMEIRAPYIPYSDESGFVGTKQFLAGWWGEQRPLTGAETANLFMNLHFCHSTRALMMAFSQTSKSEEVTDYMIRGKNIIEKHIEIYSGFLKESDLPASVSWDNEVAKSSTWTFSDQLMMFQICLLGEKCIANFGVSISLSHRRDLAVNYMRLSAEFVKYMSEGANIMIKNHWMERPPMAIDRDKIAENTE